MGANELSIYGSMFRRSICLKTINDHRPPVGHLPLTDDGRFSGIQHISAGGVRPRGFVPRLIRVDVQVLCSNCLHRLGLQY